ncbi:hypothetical protein BLOT_010818 [Blomia tropicalis]|nr:hypothetical protein BLOT_010818 [Blomia tropicalis]
MLSQNLSLFKVDTGDQMCEYSLLLVLLVVTVVARFSSQQESVFALKPSPGPTTLTGMPFV